MRSFRNPVLLYRFDDLLALWEHLDDFRELTYIREKLCRLCLLGRWWLLPSPRPRPRPRPRTARVVAIAVIFPVAVVIFFPAARRLLVDLSFPNAANF